MSAVVPEARLARLSALQNGLVEHPVYTAVDAGNLPCFMEHHVFAVLDFMWLLKSLQVSLTNTAIAWVPRLHPGPRRLVNEIVLGEESDALGERTLSHFELYVEAMEEAEADTGPVLRCVAAIGSGTPVLVALRSCGGPAAAVAFASATWRLASRGGLPARVGAFAFGREEIIPRMFDRLLDPDGASRKCPTFRLYLERHVEVDGDVHGPLALDLVRRTCRTNGLRWQQAESAAATSLARRADLWDAVVAALP